LLGLFFDPEDGGNMLLRNVSCLSTNYTVLYPRSRILQKDLEFGDRSLHLHGERWRSGVANPDLFEDGCLAIYIASNALVYKY
jgi:hypothetical protein